MAIEARRQADNTSQLKDLFFPSLRSTQARVQQLRDLGLLYRWQMIGRPGLTRRHSLVLISPRGARILASIHAEHPATYVERSRQARTYNWRAPHDLGANDFFVWLALESRDLSDSGLLYWIGEETMRAHYRQIVTGRRDGIPTPDGHANYLALLERKCGDDVHGSHRRPGHPVDGPLLYDDDGDPLPEEEGLPFGDPPELPRAAALALLYRLAGVEITLPWLIGERRPTHLIRNAP